MSRVKNYIHDIIIHVSDNETQTSQIAEIMKSYQAYKIQEFMNLKTFLRYQYNNDLFTRVDILVRKHTIEQYLKNKDYNFALYNKMQADRKANATHNSQRFKNLIHSLKTSEFNMNYPIMYEGQYKLRDGSHRLAYLYFRKSTFVCCSPLKFRVEGDKFCHYSIKWFKESKFSAEAIKILENEISVLNTFMTQ